METGVVSVALTSWEPSSLSENSILIVGPPRVGKSTLLNSFTGKQLAPTSSDLFLCTKHTQKYSITITTKNYQEEVQEITSTIVDVAATEDQKTYWKDAEVLLGETEPLALFVCCSPGSFYDREALLTLISESTKAGVYVCLIITNSFSGSNEMYHLVVEDFRRAAEVSMFGRLEEHAGTKAERNELWAHEHGLIICVNSIPFHFLNHIMPSSNVHELIGRMSTHVFATPWMG